MLRIDRGHGSGYNRCTRAGLRASAVLLTARKCVSEDDGGQGLAASNPFIQLQSFKVFAADGTPMAEAVRAIERNTYENKVLVKFVPRLGNEHKESIQGVLSKNINMFGKDPAGGIRWLYFKKGTLEQWVFAAIELERRGFRVERDKSTKEHTKEFVSLYVDTNAHKP